MSERRPVYTGDISKDKTVRPEFVKVNPTPSLMETSGYIGYARYIRANNVPRKVLMVISEDTTIPCEVYKLKDGEKEHTVLITDGFIAWINDRGVILKSVPFTYFVRE